MPPESFITNVTETSDSNWQPVSGTAVIGLGAFIAYFTWQHYLSASQWVFLLDNANLAIHESGHPITGLFSSRLSVYGGTLFQLMFPLIFAFHFRRQRHGIGCAFSLAWFGENLMNIGRYMKDARAQELPMAGGGDHDWTEIFNRWGLLSSDVRIGNTARLLGLLLALYALWWLWRQWRASVA